MKYRQVLRMMILALSISSDSEAQDYHNFHLQKTFHIQSAGGWDYLTICPANNRLYVSHGTRVNILDKTSGDSIGVIENTTGVHGIAFDLDQGRGFTSNGRLNNVTVFDLGNNAVITQITTGENPDAIIYETFSRKIVTCNGRGKDLSIIDPIQNKVFATIPVGGKPETAVSDGAGNLYVNIEDQNEIVVVDMKSFKLVKHWSIAPGEEPTGLAIDKKTMRLFAGCGNKTLVVINAVTGDIVDKIEIGDGCDGVAFDADTRTIFASNGEGTLTIILEKTGDHFEKVATIPTKRGARTITLDANTHLVYLPTAEFESTEGKPANERPTMIPGTFQVLVIGN